MHSINIYDWKIHKMSRDRQWNVSKIEIYNYFRYQDVQKLLTFLHTKQFSYYTDTKGIPSILHIPLKFHKQRIVKDTNRNTFRILEENEYQAKTFKYFYYVFFMKILNHRWSLFPLKIYWNESQQKDFVKIEIAYYRNDSKYYLSYHDWASKLKGISEVINLLHSRIEFIWFHEDFSNGVAFREGIQKILSWYSEKQKTRIWEILSSFLVPTL